MGSWAVLVEVIIKNRGKGKEGKEKEKEGKEEEKKGRKRVSYTIWNKRNVFRQYCTVKLLVNKSS